MKRMEVSMGASWRDIEPLEQIERRTVVERSFYERSVVEVARGLLGKALVLGPCAGRIVEVEAYLGLEDRAAHAWRGRTKRTDVLFGPPGHAYVYFIYGMYECLNLVAEPEGQPGCVLIRALEPLSGIAVMRDRRPAVRSVPELCAGPGRLTLAMGITRKLYGADVTNGPLVVREGSLGRGEQIAAGPRIGIQHCADWPLRFWIEGNASVSRVRVGQRRRTRAAKV
jgi:DNA-3-methyladenine glycosylase